jgi:DICT domain-containing protein
MNHAEEINKLIYFAAQRANHPNDNFRAFEEEAPGNLTSTLQNSNLFFTTSVLGMQAVSQVIENQALSLSSPFKFYSAFQRFSRLKPQEERYQQLLARGNPVYIFGLPDAPVNPAPNLHIINLEESASLDQPSLANNWFVILNSPQMVSMALVARELLATNRPRNAPDKLIYRNFEGFWTYDSEAVLQLTAILDDYIQQANSNSFSQN